MGTGGWVFLCLIAVAVGWMWKNHSVYQSMGLGDGRKFGNQVADAMGLEHNLFHTILENGNPPVPSLMMLNDLKRHEFSPMDAANELAPFLLRGLEALEQQWGEQPQLTSARPIVEKLYEKFENSISSSR